jgi:hypothetical protein
LRKIYRRQNQKTDIIDKQVRFLPRQKLLAHCDLPCATDDTFEDYRHARDAAAPRELTATRDRQSGMPKAATIKRIF